MPKLEGLAHGLFWFFPNLCFLLPLTSMREWTTSPGCHISRFLCAKHALCLHSGLWPACPLGPCSVCLSEHSSTCSPLPPCPCLPVGHGCFQSAGSSTGTVSNRIHLTVWIHISIPAQGGETCSSKQKTWKYNFEIKTFFFLGFLLLLKTASKAGL